MRGAFITVEGGEGVGKSTSLAAIERFLRDRGIDVVVTREPGGTPLGERIREWILDGDHGELSAEVEALLMFAARAHHLATVIRPALGSGQWVLCDRFTDATLAYQGGGRGAPMPFLLSVAGAIHGDVGPDLTLLLDAPVEVGLGRIGARELDHFEREGVDFLTRVRETYLRLARDEPDRIKLVDANRTPDQVERQIEATVSEFCSAYAPGRG